MNRDLAIGLISLVFLASCSSETEVSANDLSQAGFWKQRIVSDLKPGTPVEEVHKYLQSNGASDIVYSTDRRTLQAAQTIQIIRYFPPIDLNSIRTKCIFDASSQLQSCSVFVSTEKCCDQ
jgi:hypothetical protein